MSPRRWLVPVSGVLIAGAAWWATTSHNLLGARDSMTMESTSIPVDGAVSAAPLLPESEVRALDIAFYERRVKEDVESATDRAMLASLYMQRARATGDFADFGRAEGLARRSLELRTSHNSQTFALLASALLARHAFPEALAVARQADSLYPNVPAHLALLGEIELEMGDYAAANAHFSAVRWDGKQFTIGARLARWRELTGQVDRARGLLQSAAMRADRREDLPRAQVAWFHYRLAELELKSGQLAAADSSFRRGLAIFPDDYRILGGLSRLAAARGEWQQAIDFGSQAIAIQLDPMVLGTIAESYAALGDTAQAAQYARAMTVNALKQPGPIHRAWGLFLLDHGTAGDVKRVLAKTREEARTRKDVYGDDLLAWALHKQGKHAEARTAITRALSQNTEDAQLYYHAGMIALAGNDTVAARTHLQRAMQLNPRFSPSQSPRARTTLDAISKLATVAER